MPLQVSVDIDFDATEGQEAELLRRKRFFSPEVSGRWKEVRAVRAAAGREIAAEKDVRKQKLRQQEIKIAKLRQKNIDATLTQIRRRRVPLISM